MDRVMVKKEKDELTPDEKENGLNLQNLMSRVNLEKRWIYRGSFTTPPCLEGVLWNIVDDIMYIKPTTLEKFVESKRFHERGDARCRTCGGNNRHLNPLYNRHVFYINEENGSPANHNRCRY